MLELHPISFKDACEYVNEYHRHLKKPQGHKYSIAAMQNNKIIGVVIVGRPVSRMLDNGLTLEITRCCTNGMKNACSFLYSAAWRVAKNLGYKKIITYILQTENGISLNATGFKIVGEVTGRQWNCKSRPRNKNKIIDKIRYEKEN